jgi:K+-transporting ATPase c subunit
VNAANIPPTANAGTDQTITLPTSTVTLSGSGTDPDGTISAYLWTKVSGPSSGTITNASSTSTTVTALVQGVYTFQLRVTDNNAATALDTLQVTVNAANIPPAANAGIDQSIKLPTSTVTLSGSGTDSDGIIAAYNWIKVSGPASGTITSANSASTTVTALVQGIYKFRLMVTDNNGATGTDTMQVTVAVNIPPTANAGNDQTIKLPASTVTLSGSGTDPDGTIAAYNWIKVSGPASGTITNANSASTTVTALVQGIYKFRLMVTDNNGATGTDTMQVIVAANIPPTANAGIDQSIKLPTSTVTLSGSGTDQDGTISAYNWTKISGPTSGTITNANSASTTVTALVQGIYKFRLRVTDDNGANGFDTVQVTVAVNISPTANAGTNQSITLPTSTVTLSGSGTDPDGTISAYLWTKVSGPIAGTITSPSQASTTVTALVQGVYQFQLKVTDNNGATGLATVQVTVNAANIPPTANAGIDQSITLPTSTVNLSGTGTDPDGSISAYNWTKISGPASATINNANSASTKVRSLVQGVYKFQLTVTDNRSATGKDTMQVTVNPSPPPVSLLAFNGEPAGDNVSLVWKTVNEKNVSGYDIEKMTANTWEKMGSVQSTRGSLGENSYFFSDYLPVTGSNYYRLKIVDTESNFVYSHIVNVELKANKIVVYQNVPNPFYNTTTIRYDVVEKGPVKIMVYNTAGVQIAVLANEIKQPGSYQVQWNAEYVPSGQYFYTIIFGDKKTTGKMQKIN